jgi:elongator complex protein 3
MDFFEEIIEKLKLASLAPRAWAKLKRDLSLKHGLSEIPTNIEILLRVREEDLNLVKPKLLTKPTRTISGVSPVAIMTRPDRCPHGKCTFCPGGIGSPWGDVPQSYTGHEPATMRGMRNGYDAYLQVFNRLEQYILLGHTCDKVEIIVMGGTFTATTQEYQEEFIHDTYKALNDFSDMFFAKGVLDFTKFKDFFELPGIVGNKVRAENLRSKLQVLKSKNERTLEEEQVRNELAKVKCVALCIETKPDWGFLAHGNEMLRQGCTRVELGIQSVYDDVLKVVHRGHDSSDSKKSIQILRDLGFKINFHYMPGLPLTDRARDMAGMRQLFTDSDYKPDMIKLYPCMVGPGTVLFQQWKKGEFEPITTEEAAERVAEFYTFVPEYCRIQRVQRDVPTKYWEAGVDRTNLRQYTDEKYDVASRDIRAREPKGREVNWESVKINVMEFEASGGVEFFISADDESSDLLVGFCRLRFPAEFLREEITTDSALVRELHVYGTATAVGEAGLVQHKGWGKKLMEKVEEICRSKGRNKIVVISGVGVKQYYAVKLGYRKEGPYMVKNLVSIH